MLFVGGGMERTGLYDAGDGGSGKGEVCEELSKRMIDMCYL